MEEMLLSKTASVKLIAEETCTDLEVVSCMREWLSLWEIEELIYDLKRIKQRNNGEAHAT